METSETNSVELNEFNTNMPSHSGDEHSIQSKCKAYLVVVAALTIQLGSAWFVLYLYYVLSK